MKSSLYLCAALLCAAGVASPASAGETETAPVPQDVATAQAPKVERLICKRQQTVGTRLSQSICLTRSQWKIRDREHEYNKQDLYDRTNRNAATPLPNGSGG
ncbi:MAG TPA: hypothetical protein VGE68_01050 [Sphingomicrobium sp.]